MQKIYQYILMAVALVATASCSNELDEALQPASKGNLQFVVSDFPAFGEGAATRAVGLEDAGKTAWEDNDKILVHLYSQEYGNQAVELTFKNGDWESNGGTLSYLKDENPTITAVYAPDCEIKLDKTIGLIDGRQYGMAEYIQAKTTIHENTLGIRFESGRTYSRLRIVAEPLESLTVTTETGFTPAGTSDSTPKEYTLTADDNGNAYLYGKFENGNMVEVVGGVTVEHRFTETTVAGKSYALFARRGANLEKLTSTYIINDSETHYFYGSGNYGIKVESGSPTIVLSDANISLNEGDRFEETVNAIDIVATGSTTTIRVQGGQNSITTQYGAGIFVAENSTVNIIGGSRDDKLTVKAVGNAAAIGGYASGVVHYYYNCGAINIRNITVEAYGGDASPGIGNVGDRSCQTITIDNAVVYAFGNSRLNDGTPAIGCGLRTTGYASSIPTVEIKHNSIIHAHRGNSFPDYIGWAGDRSGNTSANSAINCGTGGSVIKSTIYCYTGVDATTADKVVSYDVDGNPTEQVVE